MSKADPNLSPAETRAQNRRRKLLLEARRQRAARKARIFDQLVRGMSHVAIARHEDCSLQAVRRIIVRELDERRIDPAGDFVKLQIARLNRALVVVNGQISNGDATGFDRLLKILAELNRYHGMAEAANLTRALGRARRRLVAQTAAAALPAPLRNADDSEARQIRIASL
jgi:hypothetical protein